MGAQILAEEAMKRESGRHWEEKDESKSETEEMQEEREKRNTNEQEGRTDNYKMKKKNEINNRNLK